MIERYFPSPRIQQRIRRNAHCAAIEGFVAYLADRGYKPTTIRNYVWPVEHFLRWLRSDMRRLESVDKVVIRTFLDNHLPRCRCPLPAPVDRKHVQMALNTFRRFLRAWLGELRPSRLTAEERLLEAYRKHMRTMAGLAECTCDYRIRYAREFLEGRFGHKGLNRTTLSPANVIQFVRGYATECKPVSVQRAAESVRSFLRYLHFRGRCTAATVKAVPRIPNWRLATVPKALSEEQLHSFLEAFDRSTLNGRRNYAMALCQAVLGLRVGEVVNLQIDDIDWHRGTIRIAPGKTSRERQLPLVVRVGRAIADYLRGGRPACACRNVFVRHRAPSGPLSIHLVTGVYRLTFAKAEACKGLCGTHILRHTAATNMLQRGANLKEIADVLGHRLIETTTIYAKVDLPTLGRVAMPWPEDRP
jgi:site-specific recombinase XerD